ncbi:MAG TPA: bifunctional acetate--CoA ligase family protein/GNAT family N-acetyltransferase [Amaricoccus sp.]|nr:bifunctional acetate--CoA ligase family protein/GNAT family N-acetyltransferase [Amaricoccus sp.]
MTVRNLDAVLHPASVAVVGAAADPILANIRAGGFEGAVWPVAAVDEIAGLPGAPDIAIVGLPPGEIPAAIAALGARGCRFAVVAGRGPEPGPLRQAMLDAARPHLLRVVGPGSFGVVVPAARLNASIAHGPAAPGRLGLLAQSGSVAAATVDWAAGRGIGFSRVVALGAMADADAGDFLDLLAADGSTRAILLQLETIPAPRKFLSAARAAARLKPVIALKTGRTPGAAAAALTHTGALAGADAVVTAALHRAGVLRVRGLAEMFDAAETVGRFRPMHRARLAVVTNGGGPGVLAADRLAETDGTLATLAPETREALPPEAAGANPIDLHADAPPARYAATLDALASDRGVDALLVMHAPNVLVDPLAVAQAFAGRVDGGLIGGKPVFACWMGGTTAREARSALRAAGVACYDTPAGAAAAVGHLTDWGRAQAALLQVPDRAGDADDDASAGARARARAVLHAAARAGRSTLSEPDATAVLAAYGVPVPELRRAATPAEVAATAERMLADGGRIVVKLVSADTLHKSDLGGVALDIATPADAEAAARGIAARAETAGVRLDGFALQPMIRRPQALELILGLGRDPVFGPVILFGAGGLAVELLQDIAVELPPIDNALAAGLVARTRVGGQLAGFRGRPAADAAAVHRALVALSNLAEDFPCIRTGDVNPLIADGDGVLALDVSIVIEPADIDRPVPNPDLAISPYPAAWRSVHVRDGVAYAIRPIMPADAHLYRTFVDRTDPEDLRLRFLAPRRNFPEEMALRLSQLDYDREVAFVALTPEGELAGVARLACDPDHTSGEYATIVRSDLKGRGLGRALMQMLIDYAAADGLQRIEGIVLAENRSMLDFVRGLGFAAGPDPDDPALVLTTLELADPAGLAAADPPS